MSARLVCTAMMMWVVVFTHFSINMFMQKYTSTNAYDVVTDCRLTCMSTNSSINSQVITDITDICKNGLQSTYLLQTTSKDAQKLFPFSTLLRSGIEPNPGPCTLEELSKVIKKVQEEHAAYKTQVEKEMTVLRTKINELSATSRQDRRR